MKKLLLTAVTMASLCTSAWAQQQPMTAEQQKAYAMYSTPGEMQKMMAKSTGNWKESMTMWMHPGSPAITNETFCKNEMVMDGRYLRSTHTGVFMNMPFNGESIMGYDNAKKIFFSTWIDNMGTGIMYMEGKWLIPNKKMEFRGKMTDPETGKDIPVKEIITFVDDTHQMMELWMTEKGVEFKNMQMMLAKQ